jgi:hypothetical protein
MRGRLPFAVAIVLTAAAGVASASALRVGAYEPSSDPGEPDGAPPGQIGETVSDPRGGPPWAVRITSAPTGRRCVMVGRTDGTAFGPVNAAGVILDTGPSLSGSCAVPGDEPVQPAVAHYPDRAGAGARTVIFGVAEVQVTSIEVVHAGATEAVVPDPYGTFLVVREGESDDGGWTITVTLADASTRSYVL